jgi:ABC-type phosphate/phosphonate transport system substrate-binding protein
MAKRHGPRCGRWTALLAATFCVATVGRPLAAEDVGDGDRGYRFGVFPYVPALTIDRLFGPIAASLADAVGRPVHLKTKTTFEKFADELAAQTYDIVLVHPFFYIDIADQLAYRPLARLDRRLTAVAMASRGRGWQGWRDLQGRTVALPPALSAVSVMVEAALLEAELIPGVDVTLRHYRTKTSCLQAVVIGTADACAVPRFILDQIDTVKEMNLEIVAETSPVNHLVFAVHPRMPAAEAAMLQARIVHWSDDEKGRAILASGAWPGFVVAEDADYDEVRAYRRRHQRLARY